VQLTPCPACRRHVADSACPFCGATVTPADRATPKAGRLSRAIVFGAAIVGAGCGPKPKANDPADAESRLPQERHHGGGGCSEPDPAEIERLEKAKADASEEDKPAIEQQLQEARQPVCAPYGAPPARRRIV
jgi:hypothetical protein